MASVPKFCSLDPYLKPYSEQLRQRFLRCEERLASLGTDLESFSLGYLYYGVHRDESSWLLREWAPNATELYLVGDMSGWQLLEDYRFQRQNHGNFLLELEEEQLRVGQLCRLFVRFPGGEGWRLPAYSRYVVQDPATKIFTLQIDDPRSSYQFQHPRPAAEAVPLIYEAHVGMAQEHDNIGSYQQFKDYTLPYIASLGYNCLQLMAIQEHPYYGSFGYHVSNIFAVSSRFGSMEDLKDLIDAAHALGIRVIIDLVHSHAVRNEEEGLAAFDGTRYQYFHTGERGEHRLWDSYIYDYGKNEVLHLLLSNLRFFLDVYHVDGFRFDGVTSMLYDHHGLGKTFTGYQDYFQEVDEQAIEYLYIANRLVHQIYPQALTIAEDVSGMPGLACDSGVGFDYRMAMGVSDCWFKLLDKKDEDWDIDYLWHELSNARVEEKVIGYLECHDQALVGGKTFFFTMTDKDAYSHMHHCNRNAVVDRALALHKIARLATLASTKGGYLTFMGNEFGHPEWIDFPREGNSWSYKHARRLWSLAYQEDLCYSYLLNFEKSMLALIRQAAALEFQCSYVQRHNDHKVLSFMRGDLLFAFNFHPYNSYQDYKLVAAVGKYCVSLSSDEPDFGGFSRIDSRVASFTQPWADSQYLHVYLPSRSAIVWQQCKE